jgi:hypothetical protein
MTNIESTHVKANGSAPPIRPVKQNAVETPVMGRPGLPKTDDQIVERGRAAWERRKKGADWEDWKEIGAALLVGRREAMRTAKTNKPEGKAYSTAFSVWLKAHHFHDIDKSDRAKLLHIMENLEEVEAWRASLSPAERLRWNHPNSVWREFTAFLLERGPDEDERDTDETDEGERDTDERDDANEEDPAAGTSEPEKPKPETFEAHTRCCRDTLLKIANQIEREIGGVADGESGIEPELIAAWRAQFDQKALADIRLAGETIINFVCIVRKHLAAAP